MNQVCAARLTLAALSLARVAPSVLMGSRKFAVRALLVWEMFCFVIMCCL